MYSAVSKKEVSFFMRVIKKDGTLEDFNGQKIVNAVNK